MAADTPTPTHKPIVAFLGPPSSFTHQATKSAFSEDQYAHTPVVTIKDVFDAVQAGTADLGVVPFENSTHGVVTFTLDNLADRAGAYVGLTVCGEVYLDVHHFLLGYRQQPQDQQPQDQQPQDQQPQDQQPLRHDAPPSPTQQPLTTTRTLGPAADQHANDGAGGGVPLVPLGHVQRVLSHPQAFGQTKAFLAAHLRGAECVDVSSTSKAAEVAAADKSGATAAIAGESAAVAFGLHVLARWIEDRRDNTTRFFVLQRRKEGDDSGEGAREEGSSHKSMLSFTVPHCEPGALAGVLDVFRKAGVNLTSINSLPSLNRPFQYLFFVEFEGSTHLDPQGRVKSAIEGVKAVAEGWRWWGSWERAR